MLSDENGFLFVELVNVGGLIGMEAWFYSVQFLGMCKPRVRIMFIFNHDIVPAVADMLPPFYSILIWHDMN